jgi:hypothetical protein
MASSELNCADLHTGCIVFDHAYEPRAAYDKLPVPLVRAGDTRLQGCSGSIGMNKRNTDTWRDSSLEPNMPRVDYVEEAAVLVE